jgi:hypothetical protein
MIGNIVGPSFEASMICEPYAERGLPFRDRAQIAKTVRKKN